MEQHKYPGWTEAFRKFARVLKADRRDISAIYLFAILTGLVQLSLPLGIQSIIGFVQAGSVSTSLVILIALVLTGTFLNGLLNVRQLQVIERIKQKIFLRYAIGFSSRLPRLQAEKMDHYDLPGLTNHFFDTMTLQKGIEKILLEFPAAVIQILLGLLLLSFYHPLFIGFGIVLLLLILLIWRNTSAKGFRQAYQASACKYEVAFWLQETARSVNTFRVSAFPGWPVRKTDELTGQYLQTRTAFFKTLVHQFWSLITFKILVTASMLIAGTWLLVNQQINVGQFIAADIVIIAIIGSVEKLMQSLEKLYEALVAVEKMALVTEAEPEQSGSLELSAENKGTEIRIRDLYYQSPDGQTIFSGLNADFLPGEKIWLQAADGSGKSTLFQLLTGVCTAFKGSLLLDGLPLANYDYYSVRRQTGMLINNTGIFHGTVLENITMGQELPDRNRFLQMAEITGLHNYLGQWPQGLDTVLEPGGHRLPEHLRTRILLTRILLGHYRLILLEEPFLYLDEITRKNVLTELNTRKQVTVIIASADASLAGWSNRAIQLQS